MSKEILTQMSSARQPHAGRWGLMVAILAVLLSIIAPPTYFISTAQPAPQSTLTATASAKNAALVAATEEVLKETSEVRQLSIIRSVQSSTQSREEIERAMIKDLDEQATAAELHASDVTLKKLGLVSADFQYRDLMVRVLTEQVAGYYEPKTRQFHLADWIDIDGQKPIIAHELTHALQDQHFDLKRFEHWPKGDSDAELAAHSLIEGDATLAMILYVQRNPLLAFSLLKSIGSSGASSPTKELDNAPRALRETLLFPYQEGLTWTRAVYKQGGWAQVSQAFTTLPQSTEQVLHPEKYFAREAPVKITLPDLAPLLNGKGQRSEIRGQQEKTNQGAQASGLQSPASWRRIASDVNGEWGCYLLLDQFLQSPAESRRAAAGWAGDRFAVYENNNRDVLYVSVSAWDTENDAREFFEAYVKRLKLRYASSNISEPKDAYQSAMVFQTSEGRVAIELHNSSVIIAEGIPENTTAATLLKTLRSHS